MLSKFCEPGVRDQDALLPLIVWLNGIALLLGISYHILHVLVLHGTEDAEKEVSLWKLPGELLLRWEVLGEHRICEGVRVHVLDRELLEVRHLHVVDLILFEVSLGIAQDIAHKA